MQFQVLARTYGAAACSSHRLVPKVGVTLLNLVVSEGKGGCRLLTRKMCSGLELDNLFNVAASLLGAPLMTLLRMLADLCVRNGVAVSKFLGRPRDLRYTAYRVPRDFGWLYRATAILVIGLPRYRGFLALPRALRWLHSAWLDLYRVIWLDLPRYRGF